MASDRSGYTDPTTVLDELGEWSEGLDHTKKGAGFSISKLRGAIQI